MSRVIASLLLIALLSVTGCSGTPSDQPDTVAVDGTVTLDGEPLANALVTFSPTKDGRPSSGATDESGYFELQYTADVPGAVPGEHIVTVMLIDDGEGSYGEEGEGEGDDDNADGSEAEEASSSLPPMASDGSITKTVEAGGGTIDIELTSN